jgi:transposase
MALGRPKAVLTVTDDERQKLTARARRPTSARRLALRARIVPACADGLTNQAVARQLGVTPPTVGRCRSRFLADRPGGLTDEPRPGGPRTITDAQVEDVITRTPEGQPDNATHWSTRLMAEAAGVAQSAVVRIGHALGLKPHLAETFKLSTDPFFIDKVRDIVGVYLEPPAKAVVLCLDEKSQVQALDRTRPLLPLGPGQVERQTRDYVRHGTTSLFAAVEVATGKGIGACYRRHRHQEFVKFLERIDAAVPDEDGVTTHLILDNYGTHKRPAVKGWLLRHPRYVVHFTATSAWWLKRVERFFGALTERRPRRGVFRSVAALEAAIREYLDKQNQDPKPFAWTATAALIFARSQHTCATNS